MGRSMSTILSRRRALAPLAALTLLPAHAACAGLAAVLTPYGGDFAKIVTAVTSGTPPDVHSLPGGQIGSFPAGNQLMLDSVPGGAR
jgi:hypothetical protein